jgi:hypothetical protein
MPLLAQAHALLALSTHFWTLVDKEVFQHASHAPMGRFLAVWEIQTLDAALAPLEAINSMVHVHHAFLGHFQNLRRWCAALASQERTLHQTQLRVPSVKLGNSVGMQAAVHASLVQ